MRRTTASQGEKMNHPRRWIVASGLLLTAAAIAVQIWHRPLEDEPVAAATPPAAVPLSAVVPPPASEPVVEPASATPSAPAGNASTASAAASGAAGKTDYAFKPPDVQDFGQIALIGMHGGTPKQAAEAAFVLQTCLDISLADLSGEVRRSKLQEAEKHGKIAAAEWLESQCKSITPDMQAQRGALAARAVEAGISGAALAYGRSVGYRPPEAMRQPLLDAMKAEFRDGDRRIVDELAFNGMTLGLTVAEARAYMLVSISEVEGEAKRLREAVIAEGPFKGLSEEDLRQSETIAERLKQERKPPKRRNG
jgi:hypothetical protein